MAKKAKKSKKVSKKKAKKTPKKKAKKKAKKTTAPSQKGKWGKAMKSGAKSMSVKASTWGMARETFKRTQKNKVFRTAKADPKRKGYYKVYYNDRKKKTKVTGSATSAVKKYWGKK